MVPICDLCCLNVSVGKMLVVSGEAVSDTEYEEVTHDRIDLCSSCLKTVLTQRENVIDALKFVVTP